MPRRHLMRPLAVLAVPETAARVAASPRRVPNQTPPAPVKVSVLATVGWAPHTTRQRRWCAWAHCRSRAGSRRRSSSASCARTTAASACATSRGSHATRTCKVASPFASRSPRTAASRDPRTAAPTCPTPGSCAACSMRTRRCHSLRPRAMSSPSSTPSCSRRAALERRPAATTSRPRCWSAFCRACRCSVGTRRR